MAGLYEDAELENQEDRPITKLSSNSIVAVGRSRGFMIIDESRGQVESDGANKIAALFEEIRINPNDPRVIELIEDAGAVGRDSKLITAKDWAQAKTSKKKLAVLNLAVTRVQRDEAFRAYNQLIEEADEDTETDEVTCRDIVAKLAAALLKHAAALETEYLRHEPGDQQTIDKECDTAYLLSHDLLGGNEEEQEAFEKLSPGQDKIKRAWEIIDANLKR